MNNYLESRPHPSLPPHVRRSTSWEAAVSLQPQVSRLASEVLVYIEECGAQGASSDEIEIGLKMRHQTCSARIRELFLKGQIRDSGLQRFTRSGRKAICWTVVPVHGEASHGH